MEDGVVSGVLCRSTQFYAETVTTGSSTKNDKNLSCVGQAFQLVAMVLDGLQQTYPNPKISLAQCFAYQIPVPMGDPTT